MPGAKRHAAKACQTPHIIKPGVYAFWKGGSDDLKRFVTQHIGLECHSLGEFIRWLQGENMRTRLANHVLLFWCITRFWANRRL